MEIVHASSLESADGTQIGVAYELRWELRGDLLRLQLVGGRRTDVDLGDADFFDVQHSAFFNSVPVVPNLTAEPLRPPYEPRGDHVVRYSSPGFAADIEFDADGFVTLYHGYLKRIA
jgi:hypothetical protein